MPLLRKALPTSPEPCRNRNLSQACGVPCCAYTVLPSLFPPACSQQQQRAIAGKLQQSHSPDKAPCWGWWFGTDMVITAGDRLEEADRGCKKPRAPWAR